MNRKIVITLHGSVRDVTTEFPAESVVAACNQFAMYSRNGVEATMSNKTVKKEPEAVKPFVPTAAPIARSLEIRDSAGGTLGVVECNSLDVADVRDCFANWAAQFKSQWVECSRPPFVKHGGGWVFFAKRKDVAK